MQNVLYSIFFVDIFIDFQIWFGNWHDSNSTRLDDWKMIKLDIIQDANANSQNGKNSSFEYLMQIHMNCVG